MRDKIGASAIRLTFGAAGRPSEQPALDPRRHQCNKLQNNIFYIWKKRKKSNKIEGSKILGDLMTLVILEADSSLISLQMTADV